MLGSNLERDYLNSILEKLDKGYSMETYKHYKSSRKKLATFIKYQYKKIDYPIESIKALIYVPLIEIYRKSSVEQEE